MTATTPPLPPADTTERPRRGGGFRGALRAEWTKLRSVRGNRIALAVVVLLTVGLSALAALGSNTDANENPHFTDQVTFAHQPLTGDGMVTVRVAAQGDSHPWAKAGILLKAGTTEGSPYAALLVTPEHGTRLQADYTTEKTGPRTGAPRWLRLTRAGTTATGYQSTDGQHWSTVGTVDVPGLPRAAEAGVFVTSPTDYAVERDGATGTRRAPAATTGIATFDHLAISPAAAAPWTVDLVGGATGGGTARGEAATLTGSGDLGGIGIGGITSGDDDTVIDALIGVQVGLLAVIGLGVTAMTGEYRTGTIATTFAANPRRGQVLAAKTVVVGTTMLAAGLVASVGAFLVAQPFLHRGGFNPPAYPHPRLTDPTVVRAVAGTALVLAVLAVLSLAVGALLRRTAAAFTLIVAVTVLPQLVASVLSTDATRWVQRATPIAGLAIQQTRDRFDTAIGPWAGFGVLCAYTATALAAAVLRLRTESAARRGRTAPARRDTR